MCGIFGITGTENIALQILFGLFDLQHRGEQAAGIAVSDGRRIRVRKKEGLVTGIFEEEEILAQLVGRFGIGHNRYSTIGDLEKEEKELNIQPIEGSFRGEPFFLVHNGNLIDDGELKRELEEGGYQFKTYSKRTGKILDTELIVGLLSISDQPDISQALLKSLPKLRGSFSLIILFKDKIIGVRDKYGIRPLCLGRHESGFILASESCAFHTIGASFIRDIQPAEVIILDENGINPPFWWINGSQLKLCIFELIYFARPDSIIDKASPYFHRLRAGELSARENPVEADLITPVPESGEIYSLGFSQGSKIPIGKAIFKNRYFLGDVFSAKSRRFVRTFLTDRATNRRKAQKYKFYCLRRVAHNKRIAIIDDSLIRGNVIPEIVAMSRKQGACEVHVRICAPPIRYPCFLGIDMPTKGELIAASLSIEEIRKHIEADSLGYLSIEGLIEASGLARENFCLGCFTGEYPVSPPEEI
jgi:amidophosphoribosyltransferase